jgi:single-strand DNA-binding protein
MSTFNRIIVVGNLGRDPELRYSPQGLPVCSFSLATNERQKDKQTGELVDSTIWYRANIFGRKAEVAAQYLQKGSPVYIDGKLKPEEWTDRDGKARFTLNINASDFNFIGNTNGREEAASPAPKAAAATAGNGSRTGVKTAPASNAPAPDDDFDF